MLNWKGKASAEPRKNGSAGISPFRIERRCFSCFVSLHSMSRQSEVASNASRHQQKRPPETFETCRTRLYVRHPNTRTVRRKSFSAWTGLLPPKVTSTELVLRLDRKKKRSFSYLNHRKPSREPLSEPALQTRPKQPPLRKNKRDWMLRRSGWFLWTAAIIAFFGNFLRRLREVRRQHCGVSHSRTTRRLANADAVSKF